MVPVDFLWNSLIVTALWGYYFEWFLLTFTGLSYCHFLWNLLLSWHHGAITASGSLIFTSLAWNLLLSWHHGAITVSGSHCLPLDHLIFISSGIPYYPGMMGLLLRVVPVDFLWNLLLLLHFGAITLNGSY